jgi:urease gamma subunit
VGLREGIYGVEVEATFPDGAKLASCHTSIV